MKSVCFIFQIHQPFNLRRYRFFDIGSDHCYYDDYANETNFRKMASQCYLPVNDMLLRNIKRLKGKFRVAFNISGVTVEQMSLYSPQVRQSFRELADSDCVEFLSGTYSHSLSSLAGFEAFTDQVIRHKEAIFELTGRYPKVFQNTEMIYSDAIGAMIAGLGYEAVIAEGARNILGWKSPNCIYSNPTHPYLKVLMRNSSLSDYIAFLLSDSSEPEPLPTPENFISRLRTVEQEEAVVNICMDYETIRVNYPEKSGIFSFLDQFFQLMPEFPEFGFSTPSEVADRLQPVSMVNVPNPVSGAENERDLELWTGNDLQNEALGKLYELSPLMVNCPDPAMKRDWQNLQSSDHFYFMTTKQFTPDLLKRRNPYHSPYDAFINYMNVLSDFNLRLHQQFTGSQKKEEMDYLKSLLKRKDLQIVKCRQEIRKLQKETKGKKE